MEEMMYWLVYPMPALMNSLNSCLQRKDRVGGSLMMVCLMPAFLTQTVRTGENP